MSIITQRVRPAAAALALGFALAALYVGSALAAGNVPTGYTAQQWRADQLRSQGLNQKYHLGAYRTSERVRPRRG